MTGTPALRIEGFVIVSGEGNLADAAGVMPDVLKFEGDQRFFADALDRAALIVHGRNSFEDQPASPRRKRLLITRQVASLGSDPTNPNAVLWNPAGCSFDEARARTGVEAGMVAVIGGPDVFAMFYDRYDTFWLSDAPHVRLPGGQPCFPGVPAQTPQQILTAHGLVAAERIVLDAAHDVGVTPWRRATG
ncbi:dihydrofolate reductase [Rhodopseudomonas sp. HC1]|uniref:dihydrofolate reductase n=1 Tax=Rhodopseudomonas infernalis TaxID=2897386 RepID=UPI001EE94E52|nr:dihydrofolate reductase [Rhodopseudomonas infernalis]MCG6204426.1 dihydrofolate reductase [Rhodopseudomonas infernalis]